jgi:aspartyl-tRNA(Asn)/glutamyl-tRNA(Gln) amidotransferase subunit B
MRSKEEAHDYRYFPDPDLPPLAVSEANLTELRDALPELPHDRRARWQRDHGLTPSDAAVLSAHPKIADYFESVVEARPTDADWGKTVANFIQSEVLRYATTRGLDASFGAPPDRMAALLALVCDGTISRTAAKEVLADMVATGKTPKDIVEARGLGRISDAAKIEVSVQETLEKNQEQIRQYRAGKKNLLGFFVGQVMRATKGTADPALVNQILRKLLDS